MLWHRDQAVLLPPFELLLQYGRRVPLLLAGGELLQGQGRLLLSPLLLLLQRHMLWTISSLLRHCKQPQVLPVRPSLLREQMLQGAYIREHHL